MALTTGPNRFETARVAKRVRSAALTSEGGSGGNGSERDDDGDGDGEDAFRRDDKTSRKRTKTGCLTCRKRRIKCGEERPVCRNCTKSRRHCEGYTQRVVFREPIFDFQPAPNGAHIVFDSNSASQAPFQQSPYTTEPLDPARLLHLRPRPPDQPVFGFHPANTQAFPNPYAGPPAHAPGISIDPNYSIPHAFPPVPFPHHPFTSLPTQIDSNTQVLAHAIPPPPMVPHQYALGPPPHPRQDGQMRLDTNWRAPGGDGSHSQARTGEHWPLTATVSLETSPGSSKSALEITTSQLSAPEASVAPWHAGGWVPRPELSRPIDYRTSSPAMTASMRPMQQSMSQMSHVMPFQPLLDRTDASFHRNGLRSIEPSGLAAEYLTHSSAPDTEQGVFEDAMFDVISDEELEVDTPLDAVEYSRQQWTLNKILRDNAPSLSGLHTPRHDSLGQESGLLDYYSVEEKADPVRNAATARIFAHFVCITGPGLSVFERTPPNASGSFASAAVGKPVAQQGLWSWKLPMAALRHQGLMHAMLALASLQIALLQPGSSKTPSVQHYTYALQRIHDSVGNRVAGRAHISTIAATLLLAFYELFVADHAKWSMHLAGARLLLSEIDFVDLTGRVARMRADRNARLRDQAHMHPAMQAADERSRLYDRMHDVDEDLISQLVGCEVRYGEGAQDSLGSPPRTVDVGHYEVLTDLFWWFLKQDFYQSILSGNPLMLDYRLWQRCPPRAPLGHVDAVYGSFDHLILLLGRISDFIARDRKRKLRVMAANGGHWKPAPMIDLGRGSRTPDGQRVSGDNYGFPLTRATTAPPQQAQQFYGLIPIPAPQGTPHAVATPDLLDLHAATQAALKEYGDIRAALTVFAQQLGPEFAALSHEYHQTLETPFGSALIYRSYDIGCLWAAYHMAEMAIMRGHPHVHPSAQVAVGMAARETSFAATQIGRIAAGLLPGVPPQPLPPALGAALCESCLPTFFAGVQYVSPGQRQATVSRLAAVASCTGWGSADMIANGIETAWVAAFEAGRGPPHRRTARDYGAVDPRLSGVYTPRRTSDELNSEQDIFDRRGSADNPQARLTWAMGVLGTEADEHVHSSI